MKRKESTFTYLLDAVRAKGFAQDRLRQCLSGADGSYYYMSGPELDYEGLYWLLAVRSWRQCVRRWWARLCEEFEARNPEPSVAVQSAPLFPAGELAMIAGCQVIGGVAESNAHFTALLWLAVERTGKDFASLTVSELVGLIDATSERFNSLQRRAA